MPRKPRLSIVIPTIEEESIFKVISDLREMMGNDIEIIVVDKSKDPGYRKRLAKTGSIVLEQKDRGVENAIALGLKNAHGDLLASIDADGTHDIIGIKRGIELISRNGTDMVLGNRFARLEEGSMGAYLRTGNTLLTSLFNVVYRTNVHDVLTGLFVMRKNAYESIKDIEPYRAGIAFWAIELAKRGYKIGEVDTRYYARKHGESKLAKSKFIFGVGVASHILRNN